MNSQIETGLEFFMQLKENLFQKSTVVAIYPHEFVLTSSFSFHFYFGKPFDFIFIVSTKDEKLVEFHILITFNYLMV